MNDRNANRPGYKKTKVGWIPEEWECRSLGSVSDIFSGGTPSMGKPEFWNGTIPWYSAKDLKSFNLGPSIDKVTELALRHGTREIPEKTILILVRGMMLNRALPVGITTSRATFNQDLKAIRPKEKYDPTYLGYLLRSREMYFLSQVDRSTHGTGKLQTVLLKIAPLPFPPLFEQKKIVDVLSSWDKAIEQTCHLFNAVKRRKKGLMQQLLTGKKRLPGFDEKWIRRTIGDFFEEVERPVIWKDEDDYSLLSVRRGSGGVFFREKLRGTKILTKSMYIAHEGDFLISKMQVLHGATGLVPAELDGMHISGSYIALRPKEGSDIDKAFFERLSATPVFYHLTYISSYGVHIEKMTFNLEWFFEARIKVPADINEQRAIAAVLSAADEEIKALEFECVALEQQKKGLMQKLLTGEVRVNNENTKRIVREM